MHLHTLDTGPGLPVVEAEESGRCGPQHTTRDLPVQPRGLQGDSPSAGTPTRLQVERRGDTRDEQAPHRGPHCARLATLQFEIRLPAYSDLRTYGEWLPLNVAAVYEPLVETSYFNFRPDLDAAYYYSLSTAATNGVAPTATVPPTPSSLPSVPSRAR